MAELDEYRESLVSMRLGELISELIDLKTAEEPEGAKARITQVQKTQEVVEALNKREFYDDAEPRESRRTKVRSLKDIL